MNNKLRIKKMSNKIKIIKSEKILIGNGLLPPKKIPVEQKFKNDNYIWDFYSEGGTDNLLKKIKKVKKKKEHIKITFITETRSLLKLLYELKN